MPNQGSTEFTTTNIASLIAKSLARKGGFSDCMLKIIILSDRVILRNLFNRGN